MTGSPGSTGSTGSAASAEPAGLVPARIVLGVSGGIAAYKACDLLRLLRATGHQVTVVPTESALRFVGAATFEALSGRPVGTDVFTDVPSVAHVALGRDADLVVVAPATADLLARAAAGRADDLLAATLLAASCPVLLAPAMHTQMWEHPATVANVALLRSRGVLVLDPAVGRLTGADSGAGRLPEPEHIAALAELLLRRPGALPRDLAGRRVVVSAGGTREPLDPVRFLGNRSSGKQGYALALVAAARGADVALVSANAALPAPPGVRVVPVGTARELDEQLRAEFSGADAIVMAAAVADFRPARVQSTKIKKVSLPEAPGNPDTANPRAAADPAETSDRAAHTDPAGAADRAADTDPAETGAGRAGPAPLELLTNPDVLAGLVARRAGPLPVIVGFAAETGDESGSVIEHGRAKLARKGCDLLVVNRVDAGHGFEVDTNTAVILHGDGTDPTDVPLDSKTAVAAAVWDAVSSILDRAG